MRSILVAALCLAGALPAAAQAGSRELASRPGRAAIRGFIHDSLLSGGPLSGATVWLEGTDIVVQSDTTGAFDIKGIRPGRYRIAFFHPSLEQLNLAPPATEIEVEEEGGELRLGTPSSPTTYALLCPGRHPKGSGVLVGTVRSTGGAEGLEALLTASWWTYEVQPPQGMQRVEREVRARARHDGTYVLCDIPTDQPFRVHAAAAGHPLAEVVTNLDTRIFGVLDMQLATGAVDGPVVTPTHQLVRGHDAVILPELLALGHRDDDIRGYEERRARGGGWFIGEAEIARRNLVRFGDLFSTIPGVRLVYDPESTGRSNTVVTMRRADRTTDRSVPICLPSWWINGTFVEQGPDDMMRPSDVEAIEVYTSMATTPPQYMRNNFECGTILIWTRDGDLRQPDEEIARQKAMLKAAERLERDARKAARDSAATSPVTPPR